MARRTRNRCELIPYEEIPIMSIQEAQQKAGWNITAFNLPETWKLSQGEGVVIAVLDTGCQADHPDLKDNILKGANFVQAKPPYDKNGHGTHCAGIICASNNNIGMVGVAPKAKVIPVKVLGDNGSGNIQSIAKGVQYAIKRNVDFISMSLGSPRPVPLVHKMIKLAESRGIPTFVAAGNSGRTKEVFYPANYKETIAIGAIDSNFRRANFSNTGQNLDFMAPGVDILSTVPTNWYSLMSGTSMAQPMACGLAALLLAYTRQHNSKVTLRTSEDYRNMFRKYSLPLNAGNRQKFFQGFGIIDPRKLMSDLR